MGRKLLRLLESAPCFLGIVVITAILNTDRTIPETSKSV